MVAPARILVVEDEPRLRDLLRLYLERDGHAVTAVGDGGAALAAVDGEPIDLVVLDLMLPGVSGEAVLTAIRERSDTPVLIASAKRSDPERIAGLRMGADDYLVKPFNPHRLYCDREIPTATATATWLSPDWRRAVRISDARRARIARADAAPTSTGRSRLAMRPDDGGGRVAATYRGGPPGSGPVATG